MWLFAVLGGKMKQFFKLTLLLLSFSLSSYCAFAAETGNQDPKSLDYLFVQMANEGVLQSQEGQEGTYQLKLTNVSPYVKYFTNRPSRITGMVPIAKYLEAWDASFKQNPPNVGIYGLDGTKPVNTIMELTHPIYDQHNKTITYTARTLGGELLPNKVHLNDIAIFVDSFCASCVGGF